MDRRHQLKQFHHVLNTVEGKALMEELKSAWASADPLVPGYADVTGKNIGLLLAYQQLEIWMEGEGLHE